MTETASYEIKTVGIIGCGVIGLSWTSLALYNGLRVIATDPAITTIESLHKLLLPSWNSLGSLLGEKPFPVKNLEFTADILPRLIEVDYVQEVSLL